MKSTWEELMQMDQITRKLMMMHKANYMCKEKKKEEDSPALKIAWIHQYKNTKTTYKKQQRKVYYSDWNSTDSIMINRIKIMRKQK